MTYNISLDNRIALDIDCSKMLPENQARLRLAWGLISGAEVLRPH